MTTSPSQELCGITPVEVTQADREMAARFVIEINAGGLAAGHHEMYRKGLGDDAVLVQILARHRLASTAAVPEMIEALKVARGSIGSLDEDCFGLIYDGHGGFHGYVRDQLIAKIDALLARVEGGSDAAE